MTKYEHKKGNRIVKFALLNLIADMMKSKAVAVVHTDEGYDSIRDMIHFSSDGHKCVLLGVGCPNPETCVIPLRVRTEWEGEKDVSVDVNLEMRFLHINTLERIANEVYNLLWDPESDDDYEIVRTDYVANFLDTFLSV